MSPSILGRKVGMTQIFLDDGTSVPVTVIQAGPCFVTQIKTQEKDGYEAVQIGYEQTREKVLSKPQIGHLKQAGTPTLRHLREMRLSDPAADV